MRRNDSKSCVKAALQSDKLIIVIKVGTSSLINEDNGSLHLSNLARICEAIKRLHQQGHYVILVSSGAIGVGCQRLGLATRPTKIAQKQALAAVGQVHLMRYYEDFLNALGMPCAQVLLTLDNLANRSQYINARNTFTELLVYGAIPVVNENDTVAVQELRFGDNDTLSAQVATLVEADYLFLMTDVDALYTSNPKTNPDAKPIHDVEDIGSLTADTSTTGTQWGTGGMVTKLTAARIATAAGCTLVICSSSDPVAIERVLAGERVGTKFHALEHSLRGRKRWLLSVPIKGSIHVDNGAVKALKDKHTSLFSAGISRVAGDFTSHDAVSICDTSGQEFARGLVNFSSEELIKIKGKRANDFRAILGYHASDEVIHRENLALLLAGDSSLEEEVPLKDIREKIRQSLDVHGRQAAQAAAAARGGGTASASAVAAAAGAAAATTAAAGGKMSSAALPPIPQSSAP